MSRMVERWDGVSFSANLPSCWQDVPLQAAFEASRYFEVLAAFEQFEQAEVRCAQEAKLDLQLLWLARVLMPSMPALQPLRLGLEQVEWLAATRPVSVQGWLALCFSNTFPYLLTLPVCIESIVADGDGWRCTARWVIDDEALRMAFERLVFRRHREQIRRQHQEEV